MKVRPMTPFEYVVRNWNKVKTYVFWFILVIIVGGTPLTLTLCRWGSDKELCPIGAVCLAFSIIWLTATLIGGIIIPIISMDVMVEEEN